MPFAFTFRANDIPAFDNNTKDLVENRDSELENWLNSAVPAGAIFRWHGTAITVPKGWLRTNGASVSRITYPALFTVIGYTYGGSGVNFTLPTIADHMIRY